MDGRVDVYALGCVLYECLTGDAAVTARDNELASLLAHVRTIRRRRSSERRPSCPRPRRRDRLGARQGPRAALRDVRGAHRRCARGAAGERRWRPELPGEPRRHRTFLFADVRGYTAYTREHGDEAGAALARRFAELVSARRARAPWHAPGAARATRRSSVFDSARRRAALRARAAESGFGRRSSRAPSASASTPARPFRSTAASGAARSTARRACARLPGPAKCSRPTPCASSPGNDGVAYGLRRVERLKGFEKPVGVVEIHPAERAPRREVARTLKRAALGSCPRKRLGLAAALVAVAVGVVVGLVAVGGLCSSTRGEVDRRARGGERRRSSEHSVDAGGQFEQIVNGKDALYGLDLEGGLLATIDPATGAIAGRPPPSPG